MADLQAKAKELTALGTDAVNSGQNATADWAEVEVTAREIADGLRRPGDKIDHHDLVGATGLPIALSALFKRATTNLDPAKLACYELLRVCANLCMNHDVNRDRLLKAGVVLQVLIILRNYEVLLASSNPTFSAAGPDPAASLSLSDLKIMKTCIGVLLNVSMDYNASVTYLLEKDAHITILRLSAFTYPAGQWITDPASEPVEESKQRWIWRAGLSSWSWRALEVLKFSETDTTSEPEALIYLTSSLSTFAPPYAILPNLVEGDHALLTTLLEADIEVLDYVATTLEALSLDDQVPNRPVRRRTGSALDPLIHILFGSTTPSTLPPNAAFRTVLHFIETANTLPYWELSKSRREWDKTLSLCKGAIVKAVIAVAAEDSLVPILWGTDADVKNGGSWFVQKMLAWLRTHTPSGKVERDDLVVCAALCLGNLAREDRCTALVNAPLSVLELITPYLTAESDVRLKYGVTGLLKNLAVAPGTRPQLASSRIVTTLIKSKVWDQTGDLTNAVQLAAIGTTKHAVTGSSNISAALEMFEQVEGVPTGFEQIISLIRRTDYHPIRNEGTRIMVNLVKTLWIPPASTSAPQTVQSDSQQLSARRSALQRLTSEIVADSIAEMIGRSEKYDVVLNEGIMALTLLANHPLGAPEVLDALVAQLGPGTPAATERSEPLITLGQSAGDSSEPQGAQSALEALVNILSDNREPSFPPELQSNACQLLNAVSKSAAELDSDHAPILVKVREATRPALASIANRQPTLPLSNGQPAAGGAPSPNPNRENHVREVAKRTLSLWAAKE